MKIIKGLLLAATLIIVLFVALLVYAFRLHEPVMPTPLQSIDSHASLMMGSSAIAKPVSISIPLHPFMALQGTNSMHADSYNSEVHTNGPLGLDVKINTRKGSKLPGGQCATLTFDSKNRLVMLCAALSGFRIHLLEPRTLKLLAEYQLPVRPSTYDAILTGDKSYMMRDTSGAYFYLDNQDRIVTAASDQSIRRIKHEQDKTGQWHFSLDGQWDLSEFVPHDCTTPTHWHPKGECDPITALLPDYQGLIWWVTRRGRLGTLNVETGLVQSIRLDNEEIQNGFAVAEDGVYIVSDHALYQYYANKNGEPVVGWRETYDRGTSRKTGTINQGSGTTPTLIGDKYITITDNADGRMNLRVYFRQKEHDGERLLCSEPLFDQEHSVTDNSMIAFNHSIIIENNAGYKSVFDQSDMAHAGGGITRVDINDDDSGCQTVWHSNERSPSVVAKFAANTGLAYFYTFEVLGNGEHAWYLMALDYQTGTTQFKILTGLGNQFNNNWSPLTLGPDGTAYVGTFGGLIAVWDAQ